MTDRSGYYLMHRGWMDNAALGGRREAFCRRAAWAWLIEEAAWTDRRVSVGGRTVVISRGQVVHSFRHMAKAWRWSLANVQRFIDRLKTDTMIDTSSGTGRLVITICNYDAYQAAQRDGDTLSDTPSGTAAVRQRYGSGTKENEGKEGKEKRKRETLSPVPREAGEQQPDLLPTALVLKMPMREVQEAVDVWNEVARRHGLDAFDISNIKPGQRSALRARLREAGGIDGWRHAVGLLDTSAFLRGEKTDFRCDMEFLLKQQMFGNLMRGKYQDRRPASPADAWAAVGDQLRAEGVI